MDSNIPTNPAVQEEVKPSSSDTIPITEKSTSSQDLLSESIPIPSTTNPTSEEVQHDLTKTENHKDLKKDVLTNSNPTQDVPTESSLLDLEPTTKSPSKEEVSPTDTTKVQNNEDEENVKVSSSSVLDKESKKELVIPTSQESTTSPPLQDIPTESSSLLDPFSSTKEEEETTHLEQTNDTGELQDSFLVVDEELSSSQKDIPTKSSLVDSSSETTTSLSSKKETSPTQPNNVEDKEEEEMHDSPLSKESAEGQPSTIQESSIAPQSEEPSTSTNVVKNEEQERLPDDDVGNKSLEEPLSSSKDPSAPLSPVELPMTDSSSPKASPSSPSSQEIPTEETENTKVENNDDSKEEYSINSQDVHNDMEGVHVHDIDEEEEEYVPNTLLPISSEDTELHANTTLAYQKFNSQYSTSFDDEDDDDDPDDYTSPRNLRKATETIHENTVHSPSPDVSSFITMDASYTPSFISPTKSEDDEDVTITFSQSDSPVSPPPPPSSSSPSSSSSQKDVQGNISKPSLTAAHSNTDTNVPSPPTETAKATPKPAPAAPLPTSSASAGTKPAGMNIRNRFAFLKSKADMVIQNSEVLKTAQKNIGTMVEKGVRAVDKHNAATAAARGTSANKEDVATSSKQVSTKPEMKDMGIGEAATPVATNRSTKHSTNITNTSLSPVRRKNSVASNHSKKSKDSTKYDEDDISYYSGSDTNSDGSSVFIGDDDDDSYSMNSDTQSENSSIHVKKAPTEPTQNTGADGSNSVVSMESTSTINTNTTPSSPIKNIITHRKSLSPQKSDKRVSSPKKSSPKKRPTSPNASTDAEATSSYRGRYNISGRAKKMNTRPGVLFQSIQERVSGAVSVPLRPQTPPPASASSPNNGRPPLSSSSLSSLESFPGKPAQDQSFADSTGGGTQPSQTSLIFKNKSAAMTASIQAILQKLNPGEYVMLLGVGMLGVNLKQTYLQGSGVGVGNSGAGSGSTTSSLTSNNPLGGRGVYVDYMVPGGNAAKSNVVWVGDSVVSVGETNVQRGTIWDVPGIIAKAKRPVILVLNGQHHTEWQEMDHIAVAIGMINRMREENKRGISSLPIGTAVNAITGRISPPITPSKSLLDTSIDSVDNDPDVDGEQGKTTDNFESGQSGMKTISILPSPPPAELRKSLESYAAIRNNQSLSLSYLASVAQHDDRFRKVLLDAFTICCVDNRRLPFFAAYLSNEDSFLSDASNTSNNYKKSSQASRKSATENIARSTQLMLFLELLAFRDLYDATPSTRRFDHAEKIFKKYFLSDGSEGDAPVFDMRSLYSIEELSSFKTQMEELKKSKESVDRYLFKTIEAKLEISLAGAEFASFLLSDECARMRAYMRGTSPYVDPPIIDILRNASSGDSILSSSVAKTHLSFIMMFLLSSSEHDDKDKNFDSMEEKNESESKRIVGAAGGISCVYYVKRVLLPLINKTRDHLEQESNTDSETSITNSSKTRDICKNLISTFEHFWESFIAPAGGSLDSLSHKHSNESQIVLDRLRRMVILATSPSGELSREKRVAYIIDSLAKNTELVELLERLSEELIYDYAVNAHLKYRGHILHEMMCLEVSNNTNKITNTLLTTENEDSKNQLPALSKDSLSRLMKRIELPDGLSKHRPVHQKKENQKTQEVKNIENQSNADFAVVFGSDAGMDSSGQLPDLTLSPQQSVRRFKCAALNKYAEQVSQGINVDDLIPMTLENYSVVPSQRRKAFSDQRDGNRKTHDGWEVSLIDFMIPNAYNQDDSSSADGSLFGVSLVFFRNSDDIDRAKIDNLMDSKIELVTKAEQESQPHTTGGESPKKFISPLEFTRNTTSKETQIKINVDDKAETFNKRLSERQWSSILKNHIGMNSKKHITDTTVGLVLISRNNVIPAMRSSLTRLYEDFLNASRGIHFPLVDILGNFRNIDVESCALSSILSPYIKYGSSNWINRPLSVQGSTYETNAMDIMTKSLPPVPIALLFITALLEQKIVLSSARRSILLSIATALKSILQPLEWSHLFVPLVPTSLASDLVQYPAPFILGIPSDDKGSMELLNTLPDDVTLVDIDVGRVILAKSFSHNVESTTGDGVDEKTTTTALRSQVLMLAESLGSVLGASQYGSVWCCDSPLNKKHQTNNPSKDASTEKQVNVVQKVCKTFVKELLAGTNTCCFWVEEDGRGLNKSNNVERNILFDEDRYHLLKSLRAKGSYLPLLLGEEYLKSSETLSSVKGNMNWEKLDVNPSLALNPESFSLILHTFLRGQCLSLYLSSRSKESMAYW